MFKYLVCCCDNIIIIIKTKDEFQYAYFPKQNIIQFDKDKFTYINKLKLVLGCMAYIGLIRFCKMLEK